MAETKSKFFKEVPELRDAYRQQVWLWIKLQVIASLTFLMAMHVVNFWGFLLFLVCLLIVQGYGFVLAHNSFFDIVIRLLESESIKKLLVKRFVSVFNEVAHAKQQQQEEDIST